MCTYQYPCTKHIFFCAHPHCEQCFSHSVHCIFRPHLSILPQKPPRRLHLHIHSRMIHAKYGGPPAVMFAAICTPICTYTAPCYSECLTAYFCQQFKVSEGTWPSGYFSSHFSVDYLRPWLAEGFSLCDLNAFPHVRHPVACYSGPRPLIMSKPIALPHLCPPPLPPPCCTRNPPFLQPPW